MVFVGGSRGMGGRTAAEADPCIIAMMVDGLGAVKFEMLVLVWSV